MIIYESPVEEVAPSLNDFCCCDICHYGKILNFKYAVYKQKPLRRNAYINYINIKNSNGKYFLSFPQILFKIISTHRVAGNGFSVYTDFHSMQVVCADNENKFIYELPLGNINNGDNKYTCLGLPLSGFSNIEEIVSYFWASTFTASLHNNIFSDLSNWGINDTAFHRLYWKTEISNPQVWQQKTKNDINWIPQPNELIKLGDYDEFVKKLVGKK